MHAGVLVPFALGGGLLLSLAFAPVALSLCAIAAVAVLQAVVTASRRRRVSLLMGALFGLGVLLPAISWQLLLTPEAYAGLVAAQVPFYAALGLGLHLVRTWRAAPLWAAGLWTATEAAFSTVPFGGFPWLRLGHALVNSPLVDLLAVIGTGGVTFVAALLGSVLVWRGPLTVRLGTWVAVALVTGAVGALLPTPVSVGRASVGWVQGGVRAEGIYGIGAPRTTTRAHAAAVDDLMGRVAARELAAPDFVVAPENTTDMDPAHDATTRDLVEAMVARAGVPVLIGAPLAGTTPDTRRTAALWWTADGPRATYLKKHLVPMGEWIPLREVFLPLVPALEYVGAQTVPGTEPGALPVRLPNGTDTTIGVAICYDVAYAGAFRAMVDAGAEVLVVQSNNAMFAPSPQLRQQFDITRARAAEVGRPVLVVTVSGTSGLIDPRGAFEVFPEGARASGVVELALLRGRTPFVAGGWLVEPVVAWGTLLGAAGVALAARRPRMRNNGRAPESVPGRTEK